MVDAVTGPPPGVPSERPAFERPVRVKVGRARPYEIGVVRGTTWPEVSRALADLLRSTAAEIDARLDAEQHP
jgi:hypothetical protein